jgi:Reverse transcriptase (RNA-dependent DNA polymerase)
MATFKGPEEWMAVESSPGEAKKHGTAVLSKLPVTDRGTGKNIAAAGVTWEGEEIIVISAYFPNHEDETIEVTKKLDKILTLLKGKRIILSADFNATENLSKYNTGGTSPPTQHRGRRAAIIDELLSKWRLKDTWSSNSNPNRIGERKTGAHLTHWNAAKTRGVRIDRVYCNFEIDGEMEISTHYHPGSDHKGVKFAFYGTSEGVKEEPNKALPHRAFDLPEIKKFAKEEIRALLERAPTGTTLFKQWDETKRKIAAEATEEWAKHVRSRGKALHNLKRKRDRNEEILISLPADHRDRTYVMSLMAQYNIALDIRMAQDAEDRQEAAMSKWIRLAGKPNKDFLAKPRNARRIIGNMTVENTKDEPDLPRTDDMDTILKNFTKYYGTLYKHKKVHFPSLEMLIERINLGLDPEEIETLNKDVSAEELTRVIIDSPSLKSPGSDRIPYELYKIDSVNAAMALTAVAATITEIGSQPFSWSNLVVAVLPKEADSYSTHKFRPISLLNTDYKLIMRVWANRLGPILAKKIGHHQRGFIPGRDGRENIITAQLITDLVNAKNEEGALLFLDQEKAFDMVSFDTINTIFSKLAWPEKFRAMISTVYKKDCMTARVKANGKTSKTTFKVNSGTRQGCPLSPLIYAIVADLYNVAIVSHPQYKGIQASEGLFVKITAYADDTAVYVGCVRDLKIARRFLHYYSAATGGVTNFKKSEGVEQDLGGTPTST